LSIYKPCDIRGQAQSELTPDLYRRWGRALGLQVAPNEKFVVGGDVRPSTPEFLAALMAGLAETGVDVVDVGILPTPMIYHAQRRLAAAGAAVVTASHNPADVNGLKWLIGGRPPSEKEVSRLEHESVTLSPIPSTRQPTQPRILDVSYDYVAWLQETWVEWQGAECRVVLDPMHGCNVHRARRYLQAVFPRSLFSAIHDTPDPMFGGHPPDSSHGEFLDELSSAVDHERAQVGIAFDGDGDRVAFVDNEGVTLTAEETTWILLDSFGRDLAGQPFVYDSKFSDRIAEGAKALGAEPLAERSGHAFLHTRMLQTGAPFGAEISGHYFYRELGGSEDGLYTACRLISHLARTGKSLADLRRSCPAIYMTPELRVYVERPRVVHTLDQVRATWSELPQTLLDGVRVDFPEGWALVRSSVTESALTFRFESTNWEQLHKLVWRFCDALGDIGDTLWTRYEEALGGRCDL
jgi:phosphomannomutase/phosphoglucomutase